MSNYPPEVYLAADFVKSFEAGPSGGFASVAYLCPAGKKTIGWGHVIRGNEQIKVPLSEADAETLLHKDLTKAYDAVSALVSVLLTESMTAALVSFVFNLGANALATSTLLKKLNAGQYTGAADEMLRWNKSRDPKTGQLRVLPGLYRRRKAERVLFLREGIPG